MIGVFSAAFWQVKMSGVPVFSRYFAQSPLNKL